MSEWKVKRFWKAARTAAEGDGFAVLLDARPIKTPAKSALVVPSEELAKEIAAEWDAQEEAVNPQTMPFTRSANAAIDKVAIQHDEVAEMIAAYGDSDLLCYRAEGPSELVARQSERWDPVLNWARESQGIDLKAVRGIVHKPQDALPLVRIADRTRQMSAFELTAFHDLVMLSGSFLLGLAAVESYAAPETLWDLSRLDESWQEEQWGPDDEATKAAEIKKAAFLHAARFYALVAGQG
ncbi:ATP12 family protein [Alisedimentitalea sp. MJ-SS2]|uniref:ATP12 family chaperone protein n=1 Tax=Aliisedimentitalea sp. MJ-SS2 TaxID=3049795 RepID=UPI00290DC3D4|nr:ATP12 family protein [Alisedimentitalea sp. MJ-SS2]MDU8928609.1 ATP12 family protein [Alisedimentitalea sp. MJ-SS2]